MPLVEEIRKRTTEAMKSKDEVAKTILRLAYGEIQTAEARGNRPLNEEEATAVLRKLVKSNEETLAQTAPGESADTLKREIAVLTALLPPSMGVPEIVAALASQRDAIVAAKSEGQATGVAVKHLKASGAVFDGKDVGAAVKEIRG